ncbi:retrovirus-related pol polyprotein from transposon TNT 1-94 [Tanacetum coccineum]|uniref:Retrovirus-related pol polyprotein from transposon TNT 1-94 n=1 Tax=Tanacetum coccineum TaxID=301880 RepID=A0ABQ4X3K5_9ASTR
MQEELNQFIANDVWELVPQPKNMTIIGTKWVFRNKLDENGVVSRNKARLVAQGYNQQEGIDYDETYASVARLESIRILLAYLCALDFKIFQMDVKSAFLNGFINKEVEPYTTTSPGFIDFEKLDHVYKLKKALYGLKQEPKAWYDRLKAFLIKHEYKMGMVDNTLFTKKKSSNLIIIQIYVDEIIFGSTCQDMCDEFAKSMHDRFEMSMIGELNFFLGLQIKQMEDGIFFNQSKYIKEMLKKFGLEDSKPMKTPMSSDTKLIKDEECESVDSTKYRGMIGTAYLGLWYPKGTGIETVVYADSDNAGDYVDRKRYLYVREMLFDILVLEETKCSCYIHYQSRIRKRRKGCVPDQMESHGQGNLFASRCPEYIRSRLMEAYLTLMQPIQVNKITSSCKICSGPHDTQYCMENPEQAFANYASLLTDGMISSPQNGSFSTNSSSYQSKLEKELIDFDSHQEKRLSNLRTQLRQQQDDMISKINLLWKTISEKLDDTPILNTAQSLAAQMNFTSTNNPTKEELRGKGIKIPSKLLSLKNLSQ